MPGLIAGLVTALVGLLLSTWLARIFGGQQDVSGRISAYLATGRRDRAGETKRVVGWRGIWQSIGRLAPKRLSQHYSRVLQQASVPLKGEEMAAAIGISAFLGMAVGGLLLSVPGWLLGGVCGGKLPGLLLRSHLKHRLRLAEQQFVDFLTLCANAMRAGHSWLQALELAAREMPDPMGLELTRTLREVGLGLSAEEALLRMVERLPSADLDLMITAVLIQRQVGGDLASILDNIAATIRERQRIKAEVRTITAQGRLSGWVISLLPVVLALLLNVMNPEYISLLWTHPVGLMMLLSSVFSMALGVYAINRIVKIDI